MAYPQQPHPGFNTLRQARQAALAGNQYLAPNLAQQNALAEQRRRALGRDYEQTTQNFLAELTARGVPHDIEIVEPRIDRKATARRAGQIVVGGLGHRLRDPFTKPSKRQPWDITPAPKHSRLVPDKHQPLEVRGRGWIIAERELIDREKELYGDRGTVLHAGINKATHTGLVLLEDGSLVLYRRPKQELSTPKKPIQQPTHLSVELADYQAISWHYAGTDGGALRLKDYSLEGQQATHDAVRAAIGQDRTLMDALSDFADKYGL